MRKLMRSVSLGSALALVLAGPALATDDLYDLGYDDEVETETETDSKFEDDVDEEEVDEAELKAEWQNRYRNLLSELEQTRLQLDADTRTYTKGKQRGRLNSGVRGEVVNRIATNKKRLVELEQEVADFPNVARRAGVPPGWLREVQLPAAAGSP